MPENKGFPESISDEQIVEFMAARSVKSECPCCGSTRWHRLAEPLWGLNYKIPPYVESAYPGMEVVVLYCMHCGFVRQHAAHLIRKAIEENNA
jgi:ribosomal protein L37E